MTSRITRVLFVLGAALTSSGVGAQQRSEFVELHMGVRVRIVMYASDVLARPAARAAFDRIAELEDKLSDYRPESEVRRLERRPAEIVPVSRELYAVLARAIEIASATEGAFDPTVGPMVALWRDMRRSGRLPSAAARDSVRQLVGWHLVSLDSSNRTVRLARPNMRIDLGGIAKGFILQAALEALRARAITRVLIEAGGDIVVGDAPPSVGGGSARGWHVETPGADSAVAAQARELTNAAIATSGPTEQFVEIDGRRYSHVVDPRTGLGLTSPFVATVIAHDGATADALATALTVLPANRRADVLARFPGVSASVHLPSR